MTACSLGPSENHLILLLSKEPQTAPLPSLLQAPGWSERNHANCRKLSFTGRQKFGFYYHRQVIYTSVFSEMANITPPSASDKALLSLKTSPTYGSVSPGRGKWPFRVTFFLKVERSCGQTVKDRHDFSIVLCQLYLLDHQNTSRRTSEFFFGIFWHPSSWPICQILLYL